MNGAIFVKDGVYLDVITRKPYNMNEQTLSKPPLMKWKKGLPTQVGWYWVKDYPDEGPRIVYVRDYAGELAIGNSTIAGWEMMEKADWAGPIPEPDFSTKTKPTH